MQAFLSSHSSAATTLAAEGSTGENSLATANAKRASTAKATARVANPSTTTGPDFITRGRSGAPVASFWARDSPPGFTACGCLQRPAQGCLNNTARGCPCTTAKVGGASLYVVSTSADSSSVASIPAVNGATSSISAAGVCHPAVSLSAASWATGGSRNQSVLHHW
ncbi:UNVERIFIED_CONTAM: hypothetical protein FKN15_075189 [Acipenser sinensis]